MNPASPPAISALRIADCSLLAKGFSAEVYQWREGTVLKLYHEGHDQLAVEREFAAAVTLHAAGLPVPAAHELVAVGLRKGIVFERIAGTSLLAHVQARPWRLFAAVRELADLHLRVHQFVAPATLPSLKERIAQGITAAEVTIHERSAALQQLGELPDGDTLCHGDFHPANILLTPAGWRIIDWSGAARGHPAGDVACTSRLFRTANLPPWSPWHAHALLRFFRGPMHRTYLQRYFSRRADSPGSIAAWQFPLEIAAKGWRGKS